MRRGLRQSLRALYQFRCGYCDVSETNIGAEMTINHFLPRIKGGDDNADNLVYSCHACNEFKGDFWPEEHNPGLLKPLASDLSAHLREQPDGTLLALTEQGKVHIQVLHLNRPELVAYRLEQREIVELRQANQKLRQQLLNAQQNTRQLETELEHSKDDL